MLVVVAAASVVAATSTVMSATGAAARAAAARPEAGMDRSYAIPAGAEATRNGHHLPVRVRDSN